MALASSSLDTPQIYTDYTIRRFPRSIRFDGRVPLPLRLLTSAQSCKHRPLGVLMGAALSLLSIRISRLKAFAALIRASTSGLTRLPVLMVTNRRMFFHRCAFCE